MRVGELMRHLISGELTDYRVVRTSPEPLHISVRAEIKTVYLQDSRRILGTNERVYSEFFENTRSGFVDISKLVALQNLSSLERLVFIIGDSDANPSPENVLGTKTLVDKYVGQDIRLDFGDKKMYGPYE
jgi:hypothetical protein